MDSSKKFLSEMSEANLTEEEARLFRDLLIWNKVSKHASFSPEFWLEHREYVYQIAFTENSSVPNDYAPLCKDLFDPETFANSRTFDYEFAKSNLWIPFRFAKENNKTLSFSEDEWSKLAILQKSYLYREIFDGTFKLNADAVILYHLDARTVILALSELDARTIDAISMFADFDESFWIRYPLVFSSLLLFRNPFVSLSNSAKNILLDKATNHFDILSNKPVRLEILQEFAIHEYYIEAHLLDDVDFVKAFCQYQPISASFIEKHTARLPLEYLKHNPFLRKDEKK